MEKPEENKGESSNQKPITNPHDRFLKRTLDDVEKVQAALAGLLPDPLFERLALNTLQKEETSYIDGKLNQYFSDLVFSCETKEEVPLKIAFLFEHKSYVPDHPHIQLLRYMLEIWEREMKEKKRLSLVLPILIYHGRDAWKYRTFHQYFGRELDEQFQQYTPSFDFLLADLHASSFEEINSRFHSPMIRIAFRLMKASRDEDLEQKLGSMLEGLPELGKDEEIIGFFQTIIVYLSSVSQVNKEQIMKELEDLYITSDGSGIYRDSPAMAWILEGKEKAEKEFDKKLAAIKLQMEAEMRKTIELERKKSQKIEEEIRRQAKRKEEEAKRKEKEAKRKEEEAKLIEEEAKRKEEAVRKQIEADRKSTIVKMFNANIPKESIANFLNLSLPEVEKYLREVSKDDESTQQ